MNQDSEDLTHYIDRNCDGAFQRIVERHGSLVYGVAFRMTRNRELAQEIAQSVFILLARKARSVRGEFLPGWLHQSTHWEVKNALRKEARGNRLNQQYIEHMDTTEHTAEQWSQVAPFLDDAVAKLPSADKEMVILRYFERLSFGEIARTTGKTEEACKKRAQRSLERLRGLLQRQGVQPGMPALAAMIGVYGLLPSPASAAEIAKIATGAAGAAGASATLGTSILKTITIMTTKQLAAIGAVACAIAIATVTIIQPSKDQLSKGQPVAAPPITAAPPVTAASPKPAAAVVNKQVKASRPIDISGIFPDGKLLPPAYKSALDKLQDLSNEELEAALDEVTRQDGLSKIDRIARRELIIHVLVERDPMLVLNRLEEDEAKGLWFGLLPAYQALAKKDFKAADEWLRQKLDKGLLAEVRGRQHLAQNRFETVLLEELKQQDPQAAFQRVVAHDSGVDRGELLYNLHSDNLPEALSAGLDHYRNTGDPGLFQDVMAGETFNAAFSTSIHPSKTDEQETIKGLVESIPDEALRNAALERIEKSRQSKFDAVPLNLLEQ